MQGAIAHLIGSIAGGDMPIGLRAAVTFALFGFLARLSGVLGDRREFYAVARLLRTLIWPTRAGTEVLIRDLADPFAPSAEAQATPEKKRDGQRNDASNQLTWREWAMMPLMGPVVLSGFVSGIVSTFLLDPLVSFAWRRRKYMADAAAVRLTRDPDTLAAALRQIIEHGGTGLQGWTLCTWRSRKAGPCRAAACSAAGSFRSFHRPSGATKRSARSVRRCSRSGARGRPGRSALQCWLRP
jgi:hypothetical protein